MPLVLLAAVTAQAADPQKGGTLIVANGDDQIDAENYAAKVIAEMSERTDKEIMEVAAE